MLRPLADRMPRRNGVVQAEGVADGHEPVADADGVGVAERDHVQIAAGLGLEQRQVRLGVAADDLRLQLLAVAEDDHDLVCALDDVVVRDDVAVIRDHEARARGLRAEFRPRSGAPPSPEELLEHIGAPEALALGLDVHDCRRQGFGEIGHRVRPSDRLATRPLRPELLAAHAGRGVVRAEAQLEAKGLGEDQQARDCDAGRCQMLAVCHVVPLSVARRA